MQKPPRPTLTSADVALDEVLKSVSALTLDNVANHNALIKRLPTVPHSSLFNKAFGTVYASIDNELFTNLLFYLPVGIVTLESGSYAGVSLTCDKTGELTMKVVYVADTSGEKMRSWTKMYMLTGFDGRRLKWLCASCVRPSPCVLLVFSDKLAVFAVCDPGPPFLLYREEADFSEVFYASLMKRSYIGLLHRSASHTAVTATLCDIERTESFTIYERKIADADSAANIPNCFEFCCTDTEMFLCLAFSNGGVVCYDASDATERVKHMLTPSVTDEIARTLAQEDADCNISTTEPMHRLAMLSNDGQFCVLMGQHNSHARMPFGGGGAEKGAPLIITMRNKMRMLAATASDRCYVMYMADGTVLTYDLSGMCRMRCPATCTNNTPQHIDTFLKYIANQKRPATKCQCQSCIMPVLRPSSGISLQILKGVTPDMERLLVLDKHCRMFVIY